MDTWTGQTVGNCIGKATRLINAVIITLKVQQPQSQHGIGVTSAARPWVTYRP